MSIRTEYFMRPPPRSEVGAQCTPAESGGRARGAYTGHSGKGPAVPRLFLPSGLRHSEVPERVARALPASDPDTDAGPPDGKTGDRLPSPPRASLIPGPPSPP